MPSNPVSISIDPNQPTQPIAGNFIGLSYETEQLNPNPAGQRYFNPQNASLIRLFQTLGIKSLRIGGNSVDRAVARIPDLSDIDSLFAFAAKANVKVIYSVRLLDGDSQSAAKIASHIYKNHSQWLDCFAIGNEPAYYKPYETFREKWKPIMQAILAAVPGARFCGPDTNPEPEWCRKMVAEFAGAGAADPAPLAMLTVHNYPGDCSYTNPGAKRIEDLVPKDAAVAREQMLSSKWYSIYEKTCKGMIDAVAGAGIPFRLAETNNFWYGGLAGASDTFAAALWSIDYLYWYASRGAIGLNFHTGDRVGGGETSLTSRYTAFVTTTGGYEVRPLSYGIKLFDLGARGRLLSPVTMNCPEHIAVYAASENGYHFITLINKSHGQAGANETVEIHLSSSILQSHSISLRAPGDDIAAKSGLTLGGQSILSDGNWSGQWTPIESGAKSVRIALPPATAMVVRVKTV